MPHRLPGGSPAPGTMYSPGGAAAPAGGPQKTTSPPAGSAAGGPGPCRSVTWRRVDGPSPGGHRIRFRRVSNPTCCATSEAIVSQDPPACQVPGLWRGTTSARPGTGTAERPVPAIGRVGRPRNSPERGARYHPAAYAAAPRRAPPRAGPGTPGPDAPTTRRNGTREAPKRPVHKIFVLFRGPERPGRPARATGGPAPGPRPACSAAGEQQLKFC